MERILMRSHEMNHEKNIRYQDILDPEIVDVRESRHWQKLVIQVIVHLSARKIGHFIKKDTPPSSSSETSFHFFLFLNLSFVLISHHRSVPMHALAEITYAFYF